MYYPKKTVKPLPAPPPKYIKQSQVKPIIQFSKKQIKTLKSGTSFVISLAPGVGDCKDIAEFVLGRDLVTGEKFSKSDRIVSLLALCLPLVSGPEIKGAKKGGEKLFQLLREKDAKKFLQELGEDDFAKISKELLKQLDEKDLKKVNKLIKDADDVVDEVGEKKLKEVLEKVENGGKIGSGSKFHDVFELAENYNLSDDTFNNHILNRHGPNSAYSSKSHFNADFNIKNGIDSTLRGDNFIIKTNTAGRDGYIFEQTFNNPIGMSSKGKPLYTLKVVLDEFGNVVTAFPKK